jgi:hypothetical protein
MIFNLIGFGMLAACFVIAYVVGLLIGNTAEDVLMIISGLLLFICDVVFRRRHMIAAEGARCWYHPRRGGQLFFIPVWAFGLFWMLLGTFRLLLS